VHAFSLRRQRQAHFCEFETILVYMVNSRVGLCREILSQKKKKKKKKKKKVRCLIPQLGKQRQTDVCEASLVCRVRTAKATQRNPVLKNQSWGESTRPLEKRWK
jgi:hypothetical protein